MQTENRQGSQVLSAQPTLKVMWIQWEDAERKTGNLLPAIWGYSWGLEGLVPDA
jgi:hypothetical protein